jgi:hypothetical protein|tara:strand:+ start:112 stop:1506 length:1395 start_codon:yes stop_codon:yes gene_type:complete
VPKGKLDPAQLELTLHYVGLDKGLILAPNPKLVNGKWATQTVVRKSLVENIANQFKDSTYSPAQRFRSAVYEPIISTILANLLNANNHGLQVIYSRNNLDGDNVYQWVSVWDFLESVGFINNIVAGKNMRGVKSWAVALPELVRLFDLHQSKVTLSSEAVSVIVRDDEKKVMPVPKHRAHLLKYNRFTKSANKFNNLWSGHTATLNNKPLIPFVQRTFKHSLELGGRFYGEYQRIPSKDRANIKIDGCKTLEADYSSIHLAILYAWAGFQLDYDEAYALDGFDRPTVKAVTLRALNVESIATLYSSVALSAKPTNQRKYANYKAARSVHDHRRINGLKSKAPYKAKWIKSFIENVPANTNAKELVARILEKHHAINSYIGTPNLGLKLQAVDSEIMSVILSTLTAKNIPALPVHDSIIFRAKDKDCALLAMNNSFRKVTEFKAHLECLGDGIKQADYELNLCLF